MMLLPKARTIEIVERDLETELLIYDLTTHKAYTLNETSKIVFKACDGRKTFSELKEKYQFTDDLIHFALDQLKKQHLLADESYVSPFAGTNRRKAIKNIGLATMIVLPTILSIAAPSAARAASVCVAGGGTSSSTSTLDNSSATACLASAQAACCSRNSAGGSTLCDGCNPQTGRCTSCTCSTTCV